MKNLYEVTAFKDRYIKTDSGLILAGAGYLSHKSYKLAESEQDAIDTVIAYHMTPGTTYDTISAAVVRDE